MPESVGEWWQMGDESGGGLIIRYHNNSRHVCDVMLRINYEFKSGWQRKEWTDKQIVESIKMDLHENADNYCQYLIT